MARNDKHVKMEHGMKFPNYVTPGAPFLAHHKKFDEFRKWLESTVGEQYKTWDYITGDMHAAGIVFKNESDLTAFKLKFNLDSV